MPRGKKSKRNPSEEEEKDKEEKPEKKKEKEKKKKREKEEEEEESKPKDKKQKKEEASTEKKEGAIPFDFGEDDIIKIVGRNSFLRGHEYFSQDAVSELKTDGLQMTAQCKGSDKYTIQLEFGGEQLFTGTCSCPVGGEGTCKHVVATVLCWLKSKGVVIKRTDERKLTADEKKKLEAAKAKASKLTVPKLKELLKLNDQSTTGSKAELVERVADGMAFGALPRCPKCYGGKLKISGGYMEDDTFLSCDFTGVKVDRLEWKES